VAVFLIDDGALKEFAVPAVTLFWRFVEYTALPGDTLYFPLAKNPKLFLLPRVMGGPIYLL